MYKHLCGLSLISLTLASWLYVIYLPSTSDIILDQLNKANCLYGMSNFDYGVLFSPTEANSYSSYRDFLNQYNGGNYDTFGFKLLLYSSAVSRVCECIRYVYPNLTKTICNYINTTDQWSRLQIDALRLVAVAAALERYKLALTLTSFETSNGERYKLDYSRRFYNGHNSTDFMNIIHISNDTYRSTVLDKINERFEDYMKDEILMFRRNPRYHKWFSDFSVESEL